jgi:hypothetical protein
MSLPAPWTEKIFMKLTLIYGRDFTARWEGMNICDIKTDWSHELSGYENRPKSIAWALQNLPAGKPPTVLEFRKLCNTLPQEATVFIEQPKANPAFIAEVLSKLSDPMPKTDGREWARRKLAAHAAGDRVGIFGLNLARQALGVTA